MLLATRALVMREPYSSLPKPRASRLAEPRPPSAYFTQVIVWHLFSFVAGQDTAGVASKLPLVQREGKHEE
jgi:hypothetical protein